MENHQQLNALTLIFHDYVTVHCDSKCAVLKNRTNSATYCHWLPVL